MDVRSKFRAPCGIEHLTRGLAVELAPGSGSTVVVRLHDLAGEREVGSDQQGEGDPEEMFDYGWIADGATGKSVWEMTYRNTEYAGGAKKNRMYDDSVILEPGTYEVNFVTDGSHAFNDWNSAKPRDPASWGITISLQKERAG